MCWGAGAFEAVALRAQNHWAEFALLGVRTAAGWRGLVADTVARCGRLDCLIDNAGISIAVTVEDATLAHFSRIIDSNLFGAFTGIQAAIPTMKAGGDGAIVNISSNSTQMVLTLTALYGPSKAVLANLTESTTAHCARMDYNIRANSMTLDRLVPVLSASRSYAAPESRSSKRPRQACGRLMHGPLINGSPDKRANVRFALRQLGSDIECGGPASL